MLQINHVWRVMLQMNLIMCEEAYRIQTWVMSWIQTNHVTLTRGPARVGQTRAMLQINHVWRAMLQMNHVTCEEAYRIHASVHVSSLLCISYMHECICLLYSASHIYMCLVYSASHTCITSHTCMSHAPIQTCDVILYTCKGHYTLYEWVMSHSLQARSE